MSKRRSNKSVKRMMIDQMMSIKGSRVIKARFIDGRIICDFDMGFLVTTAMLKHGRPISLTASESKGE